MPTLRISRSKSGFVLAWDFNHVEMTTEVAEAVARYILKKPSDVAKATLAVEKAYVGIRSEGDKTA